MLRTRACKQSHAVFEESDADVCSSVVPDNIITLQAAREGNVYVASSIRLSTDNRPGIA